MELRKCPRCGEMYSTSYRRCPFCEEVDRPRRGGRRTAEKKYTPGVRGPLIVILLLVLALLTFCFFGDNLAERFFGTKTPPQEEVQSPVEQQPEINDPVVEEPPVEENPAVGRLDLSLLSEVKRNEKGMVEVKLIDRLKVLQQLADVMEGSDHQAEAFLRSLAPEQEQV